MIQLGPHRLRHGDVCDGLDVLMMDEPAALTYVDPPWGQGPLSMFRTIDVKQTGTTRRQADWPTFIDCLLREIVKHTDGLVVIEHGLKQQAEVLELAEEHGLRYLGSTGAFYRSGEGLRPYSWNLFATGLQLAPAGVLEAVHGTNGLETMRASVPLAQPGKPLLDPCCGLGMSARLALMAGAHFRGNEVNSARLEKTKKLIEREVTRANRAA